MLAELANIKLILRSVGINILSFNFLQRRYSKYEHDYYISWVTRLWSSAYYGICFGIG